MASWRLTIVLWLLVLASALAVVGVSHVARVTFITWQEQLDAQDLLEIGWGQLVLEKHTLASYARLEDVALEKLNMQEPKGKQLEVIKKD